MGKQEITQKNNINKKIDRTKVAVWSIQDDYFIGKPDCHYEAELPVQGGFTRELWIEYKHIKELPKRDTTIVVPKWSSERQEQVLTRKWANRGNARVVLIIGSGRGARAVIYNNPEEWRNGLTKAECIERQKPLADIAKYIEEFVTKTV